jgi:hypothetical protein
MADGAADPLILVDLDDLTAHTAGDLAQLVLLIDRRLIDGRNPKVENTALHDGPPIFDTIKCNTILDVPDFVDVSAANIAGGFSIQPQGGAPSSCVGGLQAHGLKSCVWVGDLTSTLSLA